MKPDEIEQSSFQIIDEESGVHHFTAHQWSIVPRMIHTTADFEFKAALMEMDYPYISKPAK